MTVCGTCLLDDGYDRYIGMLSLLDGIYLTDEGVRSERERMENLNLENGEILEGVSKFCYLGDMLNGEGGSSLASISRVRCDWKKFSVVRYFDK